MSPKTLRENMPNTFGVCGDEEIQIRLINVFIEGILFGHATKNQKLAEDMEKLAVYLETRQFLSGSAKYIRENIAKWELPEVVDKGATQA